MALPSWREQLTEPFAGPRKWGTGINQIHSNTNDGTGRVIDPTTAGQDPPPTDLTELHGYTTEDFGVMSDFSFMDAHPNLGETPPRAYADYPSWGRHPIPGGSGIRTVKRGTNVKETEAQQNPSETVTEGWLHKQHGEILNSRVSDASQYEMQTSMAQRDLVRENGAAVTRGTDALREGIASRITGMKVKFFSGGMRHEDMEPWQQDVFHRPWHVRTAGTGRAHDMQVNEAYVSQPMTRTIPADVNQGTSETSVDPNGYGYMDGDFYG